MEGPHVIPVEAVEAAVEALAQSLDVDVATKMRAALEAAAPHMLKSAYDLGFQHGSNEPANPYRAK